MREGLVEGIYIAEEAGATLKRVSTVKAMEARGLEGDRYCDGAGSFSTKPGSGRHVTLIEAEAIEALARESGIAIEPGEARRNVVTRDVPLNHLVDREFTIGDAVLRGTRLCEPCAYLEEITGKPLRDALRHRAGLRAEIVTGGEVREGDPVRW